MATVTAEAMAYTGLVATYNEANASDQVKAGGNVFLHVKNADDAPTTVTLTTPGTVAGLAIADPATTVAAGTEAFIGPLDVAQFADSSDSNLVTVSFSNITSVTFAAVYLP